MIKPLALRILVYASRVYWDCMLMGAGAGALTGRICLANHMQHAPGPTHVDTQCNVCVDVARKCC
jgi:hypothetical protein